MLQTQKMTLSSHCPLPSLKPPLEWNILFACLLLVNSDFKIQLKCDLSEEASSSCGWGWVLPRSWAASVTAISSSHLWTPQGQGLSLALALSIAPGSKQAPHMVCWMKNWIHKIIDSKTIHVGGWKTHQSLNPTLALQSSSSPEQGAHYLPH